MVSTTVCSRRLCMLSFCALAAHLRVLPRESRRPRPHASLSKANLAFLVILSASLAFPPGVHAQRASLSGSVTDQSGSAVSGVKITLLNVDQGLKRETNTNESGYFTVPLLQPGHYVITAQKDGFAVSE